MNRSIVVLRKEVTELLRDPRIWIGSVLVPLLITPLLAHARRQDGKKPRRGGEKERCDGWTGAERAVEDRRRCAPRLRKARRRARSGAEAGSDSRQSDGGKKDQGSLDQSRAYRPRRRRLARGRNPPDFRSRFSRTTPPKSRMRPPDAWITFWRRAASDWSGSDWWRTG